jgi:hypothetical protein
MFYLPTLVCKPTYEIKQDQDPQLDQCEYNSV